MSRLLFTIKDDATRGRAITAVAAAPLGSRVEVAERPRTLSQNKRMHAMVADVARQVRWAGEFRTSDDWKQLFMDALERETQQESTFVPSLFGDGSVELRRSTSKLTTPECSDLIELLFKFGAMHGVRWSDPQERAREAAFGRRVA
jgi:hypothetical protein